MNVVYKVTRPHARVPEYAHDTDAGADLRTMEGCTLRSLERRLLPTGIAVQIPEGHFGAIVPRSGLIYLTPRSHWGHAPFYSCEKILGTWHIKTLWFNLAVMGLMCVIMALLLFTDCPGRYTRKETY